MLFYQAIDLPELGLMPGCWDHRETRDTYLGHTAFEGLTAVDIGPANGFWTFEMERRGARRVIAFELGRRSRWDAVPHGGTVSPKLEQQLRRNVEATVRAFHYSKRLLRSRVSMRRGAVYDAPKVLPPSDVVLMGNVLAHFRDPLAAIEAACAVAQRRVIITEALWYREPGFEREAAMRLCPRSHTPQVNHSWWQVTPSLVGEYLQILGFRLSSCIEHEQLFCHSDTDQQARMIPHFTTVAERVG